MNHDREMQQYIYIKYHLNFLVKINADKKQALCSMKAQSGWARNCSRTAASCRQEREIYGNTRAKTNTACKISEL